MFMILLVHHIKGHQIIRYVHHIKGHIYNLVVQRLVHHFMKAGVFSI